MSHIQGVLVHISVNTEDSSRCPSMEFDLETSLLPLPIASLFNIESDHMPSSSSSSSCKYLQQNILRQQIMSLIFNSSHENSDPFLSYLAVNYLDRFLSTQPILEEKPWILRLVAFSCLSLAVKMRETTDNNSSTFSSSVFDIKNQQQKQKENNGGMIIFDSRTVLKRMELLILDRLKWRMRSVTPFCFLNFFISLFKFKDPPLMKPLKSRATEIILTAQSDTTSLGFRPSIIAASALLSASHQLFPLQFPSFRQSILECSFVNKESFGKCYSFVQVITMEGYKSVLLDMVVSSSSSSVVSPENVLDLEMVSSSSSDNNELSHHHHHQGKNKNKTTRTTTEDEGGTMEGDGNCSSAAGVIMVEEKEMKRRKIGCTDLNQC